MTVKFNCTASESTLIDLIFKRAQELLQNPPENKLSFYMDLDACHSNGCPLDFAKLLAEAEINFAHDVLGIVNNIDRETGKLLNGWLPRYCLKEPGEHTPGPWVVDSMQVEDWRVNISNKTSNVACAYHLNDDACEPDEECLANANLIAAAPEMLESLEEIESIFRHFRGVNLCEELPSVYSSIVTLIAKAKGQK